MTAPAPTPVAAASHDVRVPPAPPEELEARRRRARILARCVALAAVVFCGVLSLMPLHVVPRAPAVAGFVIAVVTSVALCLPTLRVLRHGLAPRVSFALGLLLAGPLVMIAVGMWASGLSEVGVFLGLHRFGVVAPALGLFVVALTSGLLGLVTHRPTGAGAALTCCVGASLIVGFGVVEGPRAGDAISIDPAYALVRYEDGLSGPFELATSCGAFTVEHTGFARSLRRPVLACETGSAWLDPCVAQIAHVERAPDAFRVHLTDGSVGVIAPDGSAVRCEAAGGRCTLMCHRKGRIDFAAVDVVAPQP